MRIGFFIVHAMLSLANVAMGYHFSGRIDLAFRASQFLIVQIALACVIVLVPPRQHLGARTVIAFYAVLSSTGCAMLASGLLTGTIS